MKVRSYTPHDDDAWDALIVAAPNANFLHSRNFLAYHGDRFTDASLVIEDDNGRINAVFPAALDPQNPKHVISHPGATYGGLVAPKMSPAQVLEVVENLLATYAERGLERLTYKTMPHHLMSIPNEADRYALSRHGAALTRVDLWNVIPLMEPQNLSDNLKRNIRKAQNNKIETGVFSDDASYREFHKILQENLNQRHDLEPVHSADELVGLGERLSGNVALWLATAPGEPKNILAGVWVFQFNNMIWHTQYIASSPNGRDKQALHLLLHDIIAEARKCKIKILSLGNSTEQAGLVLNESLERFKAQFSKTSVTHNFLCVSLKKS